VHRGPEPCRPPACPVNYGHEPEDVAAAVRRFAAAGAGGMGIEDWSGDPGIGLYDRALAVARIEAAVEAARALEHPFVITGRTEVLLYGLDGGLSDTLAAVAQPSPRSVRTASTPPAPGTCRRSGRSPRRLAGR
jgi:hypothetical protein